MLRELGMLSLAGGLAALLPDDQLVSGKRRRKHKHKHGGTTESCLTEAQACTGKCGSVTYACHWQKKTAYCGACPCDVCASGCPFSRIQDAIDAARPNATIRVCSGTYVENLDINLGLTLVGVTPANSRVVLAAPTTNFAARVWTGMVVFENFLVTRKPGSHGPGINVVGPGTTLRLSNCDVSGNSTPLDNGGGGIYSSQATLELINSRVSGNTAAAGPGGGILNDFGSVSMTGSKVTGNTAASGGGGIHTIGGASTCLNSSVSGNTPNNCVASQGGQCKPCQVLAPA